MLNLPIEADWVGLRYYDEDIYISSYRNQNPVDNHLVQSRGVMVEVLINGQFAYSGTNDLSQNGVALAAQKAAHIAKKASQWPVHKFDLHLRPANKGQYTSPRKKSIEHFQPEEIQDFLKTIDAALNIHEKIINRTSMVSLHRLKTHFVSSNGADIQQDYQFVSTNLSTTARDGSQVQTRNDDGFLTHCFQGGLEQLDIEAYQARAQNLSQEALALLSAQECPAGNMDLLLDPSQMYLQIHESIGHPLELDRILGDERNYAGSSFVKLEDFGKLQYGSSLLNVVFDPRVPGQYASYHFDDVGNEATRQYLIKQGLLVRGLGGLESQARANIPGVANSRSSDWNRPPIDRMANINIEAGSSSLEEMIQSVERGIFMKSNRSWSIDDYRLKFQFGCEFGQLIENGKLTHIVRNPNYRSASPQFWNSLGMVGNADTYRTFGSPYCGKGEPNQVIRVGHASPTCLFKNIEVFGGG